MIHEATFAELKKTAIFSLSGVKLYLYNKFCVEIIIKITSINNDTNTIGELSIKIYIIII